MKILITVKTYPTLSTKYDELVCTAGFREDGGWIRVYPVPFRKLDFNERYQKWQWVEWELVRNTSDFRPETYRPRDLGDDIRTLEKVSTKNSWEGRKRFAFKQVWTNLDDLIESAKTTGTSLAVLKPKEVLDFVVEPCDREWDQTKLDIIAQNQAQGDLFIEQQKDFIQVVRKLPYKFSYVFTTEDGKRRKLMIEDWEAGMLFWNCWKAAGGDEKIVCAKVREKYFNYMVQRCDLHFFLGTTKQHHHVAPNPFIIVGTFHPPKTQNEQLMLPGLS